MKCPQSTLDNFAFFKRQKLDKVEDSNSQTVSDKSRGLSETERQKILKTWGYIKRELIVGDIIDPFIENLVFTPDQWLTLKQKSTTEVEKTEEFLHHLLKSKPVTYGLFLSSLTSRGYSHLANELEGHSGTDVNGALTDISDPETARRHKRANKKDIQVKSSQIPMEAAADGEVQDFGTGVSSCFNDSASGSISIDSVSNGDGDRVRTRDMLKDMTKDLREVKEEIKNLKTVERNHAELQTNVQSNEKLNSQISNNREGVEKLKAQLDIKENEFSKLQMEHTKLQSELERLSGDIANRSEDWEIERNKLTKQLEKKNVEYKHLQTKLEFLQSEHEDTLTQLKNVNKDKVMAQKELEVVKNDKGALEERLKDKAMVEKELEDVKNERGILQESLKKSNSTVRDLQRRLKDDKSILEKKNALLKKKEREILEMEKQLQITQREKESLKQMNTRLQTKKYEKEFPSSKSHQHLRNTKKAVTPRVAE